MRELRCIACGKVISVSDGGTAWCLCLWYLSGRVISPVRMEETDSELLRALESGDDPFLDSGVHALEEI